ncbi:NADH-cytochrome b5 reductase 1 [Smittium culicis]|uniref:NADH-cytochrome b5 reductase n=1 Tax=Smittium culicis TaxID=133412 RepID=A0A1R1X572_9FUNG|nr:NADH-cytochrome b5 reductase 1 [Smittium culicis]OMJ09764.1 NADH-cytochrome b5 reductase 1 [Smittium culicis]OMJ18166.1 NADH-cytochrome b5 reductase 1 [Smittium culicis]
MSIFETSFTDLLEKNGFTALLVLAVSTFIFANFFLNSSDEASSTNEDKQTSPVALDKQIFKEFKLASKSQVNSNTVRLVFETESQEQVLGLAIGQCISVRVLSGTDNKPNVRSYTPISRLDEKGQFELLVKVYPSGIASSYLGNMQVGDYLPVRGPKGNFSYTPSAKSHIIMLAGGSGITPMFQVLQHVANSPIADSTKFTLIYANVTAEDILLKDELDALSTNDRIDVVYVLQSIPTSGTFVGHEGFITKDIIESCIGSASPSKQALLCGPPPMIKAMEAHLVALGFDAPNIVSKPTDQIFKF